MSGEKGVGMSGERGVLTCRPMRKRKQKQQRRGHAAWGGSWQVAVRTKASNTNLKPRADRRTIHGTFLSVVGFRTLPVTEIEQSVSLCHGKSDCWSCKLSGFIAYQPPQMLQEYL